VSAFFPSLSVCANFITGNPPSFHSPTNSAGTCTHAGPPSFNTPSVKCYFSPFNFHLPAQLIAYVCHVKIPSAYECLLNRYCSLQHDSFSLITNLSIRFIVLTFPTMSSPSHTALSPEHGRGSTIQAPSSALDYKSDASTSAPEPKRKTSRIPFLGRVKKKLSNNLDKNTSSQAEVAPLDVRSPNVPTLSQSKSHSNLSADEL